MFQNKRSTRIQGKRVTPFFKYNFACYKCGLVGHGAAQCWSDEPVPEQFVSRAIGGNVERFFPRKRNANERPNRNAQSFANVNEWPTPSEVESALAKDHDPKGKDKSASDSDSDGDDSKVDEIPLVRKGDLMSSVPVVSETFEKVKETSESATTAAREKEGSSGAISAEKEESEDQEEKETGKDEAEENQTREEKDDSEEDSKGSETDEEKEEGEVETKDKKKSPHKKSPKKKSPKKKKKGSKKGVGARARKENEELQKVNERLNRRKSGGPGGGHGH